MTGVWTGTGFVPRGMVTHEGKDRLSSDPAALQGMGLLPLLGEALGSLETVLWHEGFLPCLCCPSPAPALVHVLLGVPYQLCPYDPVLITQRKICF